MFNMFFVLGPNRDVFSVCYRTNYNLLERNYNFLGANYNVSGANCNFLGALVHSRGRPQSDYNFLGARPSQAGSEGLSGAQGYGLAALGACQGEPEGQGEGANYNFLGAAKGKTPSAFNRIDLQNRPAIFSLPESEG